MNGYPTILHVVNRTTKPLEVVDDGRVHLVPPGYLTMPDVDPETGEQRTEKRRDPKDPRKWVEIPMLKVVAAGKPDRESGRQEPSLDGKPYEHPLFAGAVVRGRRQHIRRGSQDPTNPQFAETLIGCVELGDPIDHQEQEGDELELIDVDQLPDNLRNREVIRNPHFLSRERRRSLVDPRLRNIAGMRMDY